MRRVDRSTATSCCRTTARRPGFVSGGFFADDEFNGAVDNYGQQQFFTRNSTIGSWSNGVWNQVFLGDNGAPATSFGPGLEPVHERSRRRPCPQEEPFLTTDASGNWSVFVPGAPAQLGRPVVRERPSGRRSRSRASSSRARARRCSRSTPRSRSGKNLILTPGVYNLNAADRGHASRHGRARARLRDADPAARHRRDADARASRASRSRGSSSTPARRPRRSLAATSGCRSRRRHARREAIRRCCRTSSSASAAPRPARRRRPSS